MSDPVEINTLNFAFPTIRDTSDASTINHSLGTEGPHPIDLAIESVSELEWNDMAELGRLFSVWAIENQGWRWGYDLCLEAGDSFLPEELLNFLSRKYTKVK